MADDIANRFKTMKSDAIARWRSWAAEIAAGREPPSPVEVLEAGVVLEIAGPIQALEDDATAIREARDLEARAATVKSHLDATIQEAGGAAAIRDRLAELRAETSRLERLLGGYHYSHWTSIINQLRHIQRRHPRVFVDHPRLHPQAKKSPRRKGAAA